MNINFSARFIKKDGKLHIETKNKPLYEAYLNAVSDGEVVEIFMQVENPDGTLAQLAKVHAMIGDIATHTGYSFEQVKLLVKEKCGMCYEGTNHLGEKTLICKSFGDASKEKMGLAIQAAEEIMLLTNTI